MYTLHALADEALLRRLAELVAQERESVSGVVEHLMEIDRRELALDLGYSSLYEYCVKKLGYSRQAAYFRMRAAQAARRFPEVLAGLKSGMLHLDAVVRICPHLNQENQARLLAQAAGATEREVEASRSAPEVSTPWQPGRASDGQTAGLGARRRPVRLPCR